MEEPYPVRRLPTDSGPSHAGTWPQVLLPEEVKSLQAARALPSTHCSDVLAGRCGGLKGPATRLPGLWGSWSIEPSERLQGPSQAAGLGTLVWVSRVALRPRHLLPRTHCCHIKLVFSS